MKEILINSNYFGILISLLAYFIGMVLKKKFKFAVFNPLLLAIIIVIIILWILNIDYESYNKGGKFISFLLTPATICLAVPLYEKVALLKKNYKAIIIGILAGVISSFISIGLATLFFRFNQEVFSSLLPKSVTTAIGIGISKELGGIQTITIISIIITGITGHICGIFICDKFQINHPIARGVAFGTSSHAIGTTKAMELGKIEGAMSSLSLVVAGLVTVFLAPLFLSIFK